MHAVHYQTKGFENARVPTTELAASSMKPCLFQSSLMLRAVSV